MSQESVSNFKEVTISISMSKSVYLEVPEGMTDEQLIEKAREEILTPDVGMKILKQILLQNRLNINSSDLVDWNVDELEYIVDTNDRGDSNPSEGEQPDA